MNDDKRWSELTQMEKQQRVDKLVNIGKTVKNPKKINVAADGHGYGTIPGISFTERATLAAKKAARAAGFTVPEESLAERLFGPQKTEAVREEEQSERQPIRPDRIPPGYSEDFLRQKKKDSKTGRPKIFNPYCGANPENFVDPIRSIGEYYARNFFNEDFEARQNIQTCKLKPFKITDVDLDVWSNVSRYRAAGMKEFAYYDNFESFTRVTVNLKKDKSPVKKRAIAEGLSIPNV